MDQYGGGQRQPQQSLASHFHLSHLVEKLAEAAHGVRDHHSDALVAELTNQFDKSQQLLNSIAASIHSRSTTVEGQKRKLEESERSLNHTRDAISSYAKSVQDLTNPPL